MAASSPSRSVVFPLRMAGVLLALLALVGQLAAIAPRSSGSAFGWCGTGSAVGVQAGGRDDGGAVAALPLVLPAEAGAVPLVPEGAAVGTIGFGRVAGIWMVGGGGAITVARGWPPPRGPPATV